MALGLAALGRPGYINLNHADDLGETSVDAMRDNAFTVLDAAWEHGVRHFDVARSYGRGEEFLGAWLRARQIPPDDVFISSKWGYEYTADWQITVEGKHEVKEHSLAMLKKQWAESQTHLGGYIKLYQIHSATIQTGVLSNAPLLFHLSKMKKEHGIQIGLSLSGSGQAETLARSLTVELDGQRLFSSVQATWNLLEKDVGNMLKEAHAVGWTVVIKEALANGRLTPKNTAQSFRAARGEMAKQARRLNTTLDGLALAAVLAQPFADVVLSGAANVDHLRANLAALDVAWDETAAEQLDFLTEDPQEYWRFRKSLAWN